eukprot:6383799-Amphidinium_carterae.1
MHLNELVQFAVHLCVAELCKQEMARRFSVVEASKLYLFHRAQLLLQLSKFTPSEMRMREISDSTFAPSFKSWNDKPKISNVEPFL